MAEKTEAKQEKKKPVKKAKSVDKWKKKLWYTIVAPPEFDRKIIGETVAEKPKNIIGRTIFVDLGQLSGQRQKRHISVLFKVEKVEGNNASTIALGHEIGHGFLNRLVRRRMSKVETTQAIKTSDEKTVKVKSLALSVRKLSRKQEAAVRKKMVEIIEKGSEKKPFSQLSQEMIFGVTASKLFKQLSKIAPLKRVEITKSRVLEIK